VLALSCEQESIVEEVGGANTLSRTENAAAAAEVSNTTGEAAEATVFRRPVDPHRFLCSPFCDHLQQQQAMVADQLVGCGTQGAFVCCISAHAAPLFAPHCCLSLLAVCVRFCAFKSVGGRSGDDSKSATDSLVCSAEREKRGEEKEERPAKLIFCLCFDFFFHSCSSCSKA